MAWHVTIISLKKWLRWKITSLVDINYVLLYHLSHTDIDSNLANISVDCLHLHLSYHPLNGGFELSLESSSLGLATKNHRTWYSRWSHLTLSSRSMVPYSLALPVSAPGRRSCSRSSEARIDPAREGLAVGILPNHILIHDRDEHLWLSQW